MLFYRIEATMKDRCVEDSMRRDEERALIPKCDIYFQKCGKEFYFFVERMDHEKITAGCIAKDGVDIDNALSGFCGAIEINMSDLKCEEITYKTLLSMYHGSYCRVPEVLKYFKLAVLVGYEEQFDEYFVEDNVCKDSLIERSRKLLCEETLTPELERIYAGPAKTSPKGIPVHYIIQTDNTSISNGIVSILTSALYQNKRLSGRRYGKLLYFNGDDSAVRCLKMLYDSGCCSTIVLRLESAFEDDDGEYVRSVSNLLWKNENAIKSRKNEVLTILSLPRSCEKMKKTVYKHLGDFTFVEIMEESVNEEKAREYLERKAQERDLSPDDELYGILRNGGESFIFSELESHFTKWYDVRLRTDVFPQYAHLFTAGKSVMEAKPKGSAYERLQKMTGLSEAKSIIAQAIDCHKAQKLFKRAGIKSDVSPMHMVFTGNPGTAKTTVARLFAQIMKDNDVLSEGSLYEVGRADLVGQFVGWTAPMVRKKFKQAKGGVLFIDEAYSLLDDKSGMYGDEAINTIVQEMENMREDIVVIFAGYTDEMELFLERNPGLRSRIAFHVPFADYSAEELYSIAELICEDKGAKLAPAVKDILLPLFEKARLVPNFGNGRYVRNVIEKAKMKQACRIAGMDPLKVTRAKLETLLPEDFDMTLPQAGRSLCKLGFSAT